MQTVDRPTETNGPGDRPPRRSSAVGVVGAVVAAVVALPILLVLIQSKWGVLIFVVLAMIVALCLWVWRKGFVFIELVAFLIHFDGLGAGPIRLGRGVALAAFVVLIWKLVVDKWRPPAIPTRHWLPVLAITTIAIASGAWSDSAGSWFFAMGLLGLALAFFAATGLMVDSHAKVQQYLRAYWYGGLFGSGAGVLALFLGTRSVGFGGDPNFFGMLEASMIPLTVYYRRNATTVVEKRWYTLALLFICAGAAGAGSRSGLIGGAIAIVATMVTRPGLSGGRRARVAVGAVLLAAFAFSVGFVANPANLQRGFADRGAGRLDLWPVAIDLMLDRPVLGQGFGQLRLKIPENMANTPGVMELSDQREDVSAHNTWMDIQGDLGAVGLITWITIFVVALLGFLRPRWRHTKELSTTMFVMMLPVLSGSMFLPLMNNKLAWSLIGLSAALQVPSWGTRWRGFVRADRPALPVGSSPDAGPAAVAEVDGAVPALPDGVTRIDTDTSGPEWEAPVLARWDVKVSRRFRYFIGAGALAGTVLVGGVMSAMPVRYTATVAVLLPQIDQSEGNDRIVISSTQMQVINTLARSGAYAQELQRLSGIDLTVPEVRDRITTDRKQFGAYMEITFTDTDEAVTKQALPYVLPALDNLVADMRAYADEQLADELRPVLPGEQRYSNDESYLHVSDEAYFSIEKPRVAWGMFIGFFTGAIVALGYVLLQQRRPRVNNDDDYPTAVGMWLWTHVGHAGRRYAATREQYEQVMTVAEELSPPDTQPGFVVLTTPRPDRAARALAMGVAAAIAADGRKVVLVDAQVDRPLLSVRLGGRFRAGLLDVVAGRAELRSVVRRVNRWRLPSSVRRFVRGRNELLRFVPVGRSQRGQVQDIRPEVLDGFGEDVVVVVLAPSLTSAVPVGRLLDRADAVVLALVEGRTITFDAEDAAAQVRTFAQGPSGLVMLDV